MPTVSQQDLRTVIADPAGAETMVRIADQLGRDLKNQGLSTNQIRSLFGEVRQIQAQWNMGARQQELAQRRMVLLRPKMAYRSRKERGKAVQDLVAVLDPALNEVINENDLEKQRAAFQRFVEFFEAILAYHKAYGGN